MPSSTQESPINGARLRLVHVVDEMGYVNGFESLELHEPV